MAKLNFKVKELEGKERTQGVFVVSRGGKNMLLYAWGEEDKYPLEAVVHFKLVGKEIIAGGYYEVIDSRLRMVFDDSNHKLAKYCPPHEQAATTMVTGLADYLRAEGINIVETAFESPFPKEFRGKLGELKRKWEDITLKLAT